MQKNKPGQVEKKSNIFRIVLGAILASFLFPVLTNAQVFPDVAKDYPFVNEDTNHLELNQSESMDRFFTKMDSLVRYGNSRLNVFHLGDSHIQADFVSHRMRDHMQNIGIGQNGGRGFVFPYRMAKTNNPLNYKVDYTGRWKNCRNVQRDTSCALGLGGVSVFTRDSAVTFSIWMPERNQHKYMFDQVRVFHEIDTSQWMLVPADTNLSFIVDDVPEYGYTRYIFNELMDSISFKLLKKDTLAAEEDYVLHGLSLDNQEPGIVYHSAGVNGAEVRSWLRCELLQKHLSAIQPDLIIISLGTNDAYMKRFNPQAFKYNYRELIERLRAAAPQAAFLLMAPGDNYRYRRYLNRNNARATTVIREIAINQNFAFWNFYEVMGELNSISYWYRAGLTARDRLHFNQRGYYLQADLFFNAFMQAWSERHQADKETETENRANRDK